MVLLMITVELENLLDGELKSKETIDLIFSRLEDQIFDRKKIFINLSRVNFISAYFLEKLEKLFIRAKELEVEITLENMSPLVCKVFQVARCKKALREKII